MVQKNLLTEVGGVDVGVDLGGSDGFVAKHSLDSPKVGSAFEERGGKGVSESVGRDGLVDAGSIDEVFDHEEDHNTGEGLLTSMADKDEVLILCWDGKEITVKEIELEFVVGLLGDGHEALLRPFSFDLDEAVVEKEVAEFEGNEFADTESAGE